MTTIAAVVPIFYPHPSVVENIKSYAMYVNEVYIIYNSPVAQDIQQKLHDIKNTRVLYSGENIGIAKALNLALNEASINKYHWLLTMDQDSSFEDQFPTFLTHFESISKKNLIIFSPIHNQKFMQTKTSSIRVSYVMTSGNIVNISYARHINGYNEDLFIDEVDHEFCFKAKEHKYHIYCDRSIVLTHHLGESHKHFSTIKLYPPIRLYYMVRNYLYLRQWYRRTQTKFFQKRDKYLLTLMCKQMIFGRQKKDNLIKILQAIKDYKKQIYGEYPYAS